jgi:uncharacterized protein
MASTSKRGFASMDRSKQREIASKGGRAAHAKGTAHEFTSDEARVAGRKGGEAVSRDRAHMSAIGREGGHSRGARARAAAQGSSDTTSDFTRNTTGNQAFAHESNSERSAFENTQRAASSGTQRGNYGSSPDRGNGRDRNERERQGDNPSDHRPYSGRDEI